ncbi:hypothetical protein FRC02_006139 [Tulasnella sp. 418]|nr:hypothetical protein FRC02_006139 [Tulasnella sp. 418]
MQLAFTAAGIAVYVGTIIIGVMVPTSPFRTPLSKYLLRFGSITWRLMRAIASSVTNRLPLMALQKLYDEYCSPLLVWGQERIPQALKFSLNPLPWSSETAVSTNTNAVEASRWTSSEAIAAECVIWLLEHSEHVDTTVAALHACLRLPSPLLVSLIDEREGLRERILNFYRNLEQQTAFDNQKWEELRDRMAVTTLALFHVFKSDYTLGYRADLWVSDNEIRIDLSAPYDSYIQLWLRVPPKPNPDLVKPLQLRIELTDTRQATVTNPLIVSVNQAHWLAEGIAFKFLHEFDQDLVPLKNLDSEPFAEAIQMFQFLLANQPTLRDIGYVAMAIAALHWRIVSGSEVNHWGYASAEEKQRFKQKITQIIQALDKSKVASQSVAIALSLLDPSCPNQLSPLHDRLLRLSTTGWLWDSSLASVLLESYWKHSGDKRQPLIVQALGHLATSLELNTERADSLFRLIKHEISISDDRDESTKDSLSPIIDSLASAADDDFFNSIFLSEPGLLNNSFISAFRKDYSDLTRRLQHSSPSIIGHLPELWAYLVNQTLEQLKQDFIGQPTFLRSW